MIFFTCRLKKRSKRLCEIWKKRKKYVFSTTEHWCQHSSYLCMPAETTREHLSMQYNAENSVD